MAAEELVTKEWVFMTADGPVDTLPVPEKFRTRIPRDFSSEVIRQVQQEAAETYEIVRFRGIDWEHIVYNPGSEPDETIGFVPTSYSGARKNPGNMYEKTLDAIMSPNTRIDYLTPHYNHPAGPMRAKDFRHARRTGRFTKGTGTDKDPFRALDSMKDIVDLYEKMGWTFPSYFSADAEGGRLLMGRALAFGTSQGVFLNGMPGITSVKGYHRFNVYADIANRVQRLGGSAVDLEVNSKTETMTKKNMPKVYPWYKYYAHKAPIPAIVHPLEFAQAGRLNMAYSKHNDPNKPEDHAVRWDLLAMMAANDAPVTLTYGTKNPIGPANEVKTFLDGFVHDFPADLRSPRRTVTLKLIEDAGIDDQTSRPTGRTVVERRTFGLGAVLGLVPPPEEEAAEAG